MVDKIVVNLDGLTIGDLELFEKWQNKEVKIKDMLDMLDRAVKGGVRHLPLSSMKEILQAITDAVGGTDLKN